MNAKDLRKKAWSALKGNWGVAILVVLLQSVIIGFSGIIPIAALFVTGPLTLGLTIAFTNLIRGEKPSVSQLFSGFGNFGKTIVLDLLNTIFTMLWSLLLVVPGIIKHYAYSMSFYILRDNPDMSQAEARKASIKMMQGNKWKLFCLHFSFIGWILLSSLTFGILLIWVIPYMFAAEAAFYENLKAAE
jgi:uncharacterized membrane protein